MADLSDEEKAALVAQGDKPTDSPAPAADDETLEEPEHTDEDPDGSQPNPEKPEDEAEPEGDEPEPPATFTKQFPNLKGDSWDTYGPELEVAYQNSFNEALKMNEEIKRLRAAVAQSPAIKDAGKEEQPTDPAAGTGQPNGQAPAGLSDMPEIRMIRSYMDQTMNTAFDSFKKQYPDVLETENFKKFQAAAQPLGDAFLRLNGREPTYDELFKDIANYYHWTPVTEAARKGSALRESAPGRTMTTPQGSPQRRSKVPDASVDAYLKMFPNKKRADAIKELEEVL